jgi:hypothetical protein
MKMSKIFDQDVDEKQENQEAAFLVQNIFNQ